MCLSCPLPLISSFVSHAPPHLFKICLSGPGRRSLLEGLGEVVTPFSFPWVPRDNTSTWKRVRWFTGASPRFGYELGGANTASLPVLALRNGFDTGVVLPFYAYGLLFYHLCFYLSSCLRHTAEPSVKCLLLSESGLDTQLAGQL